MPLIYDRKLSRYRDEATGRFVARETIIGARQAIISAVSKEVDVLTLALRNREISLVDWQLGMRDSLRAGHTLAAGIAGGGKANMTASDWGKVGASLRKEYAALNRYAAKIEAGGTIHRGWSRLYAKAIRSSFLNFERERFKDAGKTTAQRILTAKESCAGCVGAAGTYAIDDVPDIGVFECLHNCACVIIYN